MAKISLIVFFALTGFAQGFPQQQTEISSQSDGEHLLAFSISLHERSEFVPALNLLESYLQQFPEGNNRAGALFLAAECNRSLHQTSQARRRFEELLENYPNSVYADDALFRLGETAFHDNRLNDAIPAFTRLLEEHPASPFCGEAAYWNGEAFHKSNNIRAALKYFDISAENYKGHHLTDKALYSAGWMSKLLGEFDRSAASMLKLLDEYPNSPLIPSARAAAGESYFHLGEYKKAIEFLTLARDTLSNSSEVAEAQYLIGESYFRIADYPNALFAFEPFGNRFANHRLRRNVDYSRAWIFLYEENYLKALELFSELSSGSDAVAHASLFRRGVVLKVIGQKQEALAAFDQCAEQEGEFADNALYESGLLRFEMGELETAKERFIAITSRYAESDVLGQSFKMLGEAFVALGKWEDARAAFESALTHPASPANIVEEAMYLKGWTLVKLRRYDEASGVLDRYIQEYPESELLDEAYFWLGEAYYNTRRFAEAAHCYRTIDEKYPKSRQLVRALYGFAWTMYRSAEYPQAARSFERVIEMQERDSALAYDSFLRLGDCYFAMGNLPMAAGVYRSAIRQFPGANGIEYAHFQLAHSNLNQRLFNRAMDGFEFILMRHPDSQLADDAQFGRAWVYFQADEFERAIREFRTLILLFRSSELIPRAYYNIGDSYFNLNNLNAAMEAYQAVLDTFPNSAYTENALDGLQAALMLKGRVEEAAQVTPRFLAANPAHLDADKLAFRSADFFHQRKMYERSGADFRRFIEQYPTSKLLADAYFKSGEAYVALNMPAEALAAYQYVSEVYPAGSLAPSALMEIALLHQREGRSADALQSLDLIIERYPGGVATHRARYEKGMIFRDRGDYDAAFREFSSLATDQRGTNWGDKGLVGLGQIRMHQGRHADAESLFAEVAKRRKDEIGAEAQFLVGEARFALGKFADAIAAYRAVSGYANAGGWNARGMLRTGESYERLANKRKAKETYRALLRIHKLDEFAREADKKLKELQ